MQLPRINIPRGFLNVSDILTPVELDIIMSLRSSLSPSSNEDWKVALKNRRAALDYWMNVPSDKVSKNLGNWYVGGDEDQFMKSIGLDALSCGSVACLGGWLITMPEVIEESGSNGLSQRLWALRSFLKIQPDEGNPFNYRQGHERGSDWDVARKRLERLVSYAEDKCSN